MNPKKQEFNDAFREIEAEEFSHIPCRESEIAFPISPRFEARMDAMLGKRHSRFQWLWRRTAVVALVLAVFCIAACSTDAVCAVKGNTALWDCDTGSEINLTGAPLRSAFPDDRFTGLWPAEHPGCAADPVQPEWMISPTD